MIRIRTRQDQVNTAADRFREQYHIDYILNNGRHSADIYDRLRRLEHPTRESIAEIIGNDSWSILKCSVCGENVESVLYFPYADYEAEENVKVCRHCVSRLYNLSAEL